MAAIVGVRQTTVPRAPARPCTSGRSRPSGPACRPRRAGCPPIPRAAGWSRFQPICGTLKPCGWHERDHVPGMSRGPRGAELLAATHEQLHAEADAEERAPGFAKADQRLDRGRARAAASSRRQTRRRRATRAVRARNRRDRRSTRLGALVAQRLDDAVQVADAVVDDGDALHCASPDVITRGQAPALSFRDWLGPVVEQARDRDRVGAAIAARQRRERWCPRRRRR